MEQLDDSRAVDCAACLAAETEVRVSHIIAPTGSSLETPVTEGALWEHDPPPLEGGLKGQDLLWFLARSGVPAVADQP
jgi:hypothetical protein